MPHTTAQPKQLASTGSGRSQPPDTRPTARRPQTLPAKKATLPLLARQIFPRNIMYLSELIFVTVTVEAASWNWLVVALGWQIYMITVVVLLSL